MLFYFMCMVSMLSLHHCMCERIHEKHASHDNRGVLFLQAMFCPSASLSVYFILDKRYRGGAGRERSYHRGVRICCSSSVRVRVSPC